MVSSPSDHAKHFTLRPFADLKPESLVDLVGHETRGVKGMGSGRVDGPESDAGTESLVDLVGRETRGVKGMGSGRVDGPESDAGTANGRERHV